METEALSLLTAGAVPEDADCVMIYAPRSDISEEEKAILTDYVSSGGKLLVAAGPVENETLETLYSILGDYGVTAQEGIVVDSDPGHYLSLSMNGPVALLPDMEGSAITEALIAENYSVIIPVSRGLTIESGSARGEVTALLTTSDLAYSKLAGYSLSTYEYEEGDISGPFAVAVSVEDSGGGQIIWFASDRFLNETYNVYSSGANMDLAMNAVSALVGESEAMAIRTKSLNFNYLTISSSTASLLKALMIGVFPLAYLGVGVCVLLRRKKVQNETV